MSVENIKANRLQTLKKMMAEMPDDLFFTYAFAMELIGLKDFIEAQKILNQIIAKDKTYVPAYYQLALLLINQNKTEEAIAYLQTGIKQAKHIGATNKTINEFNSLLNELLF